jgi:hypothetical protein
LKRFSGDFGEILVSNEERRDFRIKIIIVNPAGRRQ